MDRAVLDHDGPWSEDAYLTLTGPSHDGRAELMDGALIVGPSTTPQRGRVLAAVRAVIEEALPDGLRLLGPVPLRLGPDCVLVPDLVITRVMPAPDVATASANGAVPGSAAATQDDAGPQGGGSASVVDAAGGDSAAAEPDPSTEVLDAADALMVVEVVGREHGSVDRTFKPQLYARSRIPYSLLIDHDGPFAVADMIISGRYHEYAKAADGATLQVEEPFPLDIDLAAVCDGAMPVPPAC